MLASLCNPPKPKQRREGKRKAEKDDKISPYKALFEKQPLKKQEGMQENIKIPRFIC